MAEFIYSGKEELENSLSMPRYNGHIAGLFSQYIKNDDRVLDYGAGIGVITDIVRDNTKVLPICFEIDAAQKEWLQSKGYKVHSAISSLKTEKPFQVIFSSNVLEHIPDDVEALKNIYSLLDQNGVFVTWVPAFECIWTKMDDRVGHLRRYKKSTLTGKLTQAGFIVEHAYYQDSLGFFLSWLFKFIGNSEGQASKGSLKLFDTCIFPLSKILDHGLRYFLGKNVVAIARKPSR